MVFSSSRCVAVLLVATAANLAVAETYLKEQFNDAVSDNRSTQRVTSRYKLGFPFILDITFRRI